MTSPLRARLLGAVRPSWCPYCRAPAGPDCSDAWRSGRVVRAAELAAVRREVDEVLSGRGRDGGMG